jgi:lipoprotein-releasing system ATP-binding protein
LADEPTGNLDTKNAQEVLGLMMELKQQQKSALILVTHDLGIAKKMDRFLTFASFSVFCGMGIFCISWSLG